MDHSLYTTQFYHLSPPPPQLYAHHTYSLRSQTSPSYHPSNTRNLWIMNTTLHSSTTTITTHSPHTHPLRSQTFPIYYHSSRTHKTFYNEHSLYTTQLYNCHHRTYSLRSQTLPKDTAPPPSHSEHLIYGHSLTLLHYSEPHVLPDTHTHTHTFPSPTYSISAFIVLMEWN